MSARFEAPSAGVRHFTCPACHTLTDQRWYKVDVYHDIPGVQRNMQDGPYLRVSSCAACNHYIIWRDDRPIFPHIALAILAHEDLPAELLADYEEAQAVASISPRAAAALLRTLIDRLTKILLEYRNLPTSGDLNARIGRLVKNGLDVDVQAGLDVLRLAGNNALHPEELASLLVPTTPEEAAVLFETVNEIVEDMITRPRRRRDLAARITKSGLKQIADRDGKPLALPAPSQELTDSD